MQDPNHFPACFQSHRRVAEGVSEVSWETATPPLRDDSGPRQALPLGGGAGGPRGTLPGMDQDLQEPGSELIPGGDPGEVLDPDPHGDPAVPVPDLTLPVARLELLSPLEDGLEVGLGVGVMMVLLGGLGWLLWGGGQAAWMALPLFALFGAARALTDCAYLVDNQRGELRYRRRFGPLRSEETLCRLADVAIATVRGQPAGEGEARTWQYAVVLLQQDGTSIRVSTPSLELEAPNRLAQALAGHLGAVYLPGKGGQVLEHVPEVKLPEVIRSDSERGAMAEVHLGSGLALLAIGYLTALPALWWTGPWAFQALAALAGQGGSLAAATGALVLLWGSLLMAGPGLFAAARLLDAGGRAAKREERARQLEDEGFQRGFELVGVLLLTNLCLAPLAWLGEMVSGPPSAAVGLLATTVLGVLHVALVTAWARGHLALDPAGPAAELPSALRLTLLTGLEHRRSRCGYCGGTVVPEQVVACHRCEAIHHQDCWEENGRCTTYGCGGQQASPLVP